MFIKITKIKKSPSSLLDRNDRICAYLFCAPFPTCTLHLVDCPDLCHCHLDFWDDHLWSISLPRCKEKYWTAMCYLTSGVGLCRGRRVSLLLVFTWGQKPMYIRRNLPMVERVFKILKLIVISPHDSIKCQSWEGFEKIAFYHYKKAHFYTVGQNQLF